MLSAISLMPTLCASSELLRDSQEQINMNANGQVVLICEQDALLTRTKHSPHVLSTH